MRRVLPLVFLSGFSALVYELLWFRQLGLVFGNTVQAASTVLAAYMLGMAGGAALAAGHTGCLRKPLRTFVLLELGIGVSAAILPTCFAVVQNSGWLAVFGVCSGNEIVLPRFGLSLALLLAPTLLMGATLPVLASGFLHDRKHFGAQLGHLYGINTLGGVAGVLCAGFYGLPVWGIRGTTQAAIGVNLAVALLAMGLNRTAPAPHRSLTLAATVESLPSTTRSFRGILLAAAALCGFLALAFETVWFRALILVFGSTTYSFSLMLAVFLAGIGLGAALLGRLADRCRQPVVLLVAAQVGVGLWTLGSLYMFPAAPGLFLEYLVHTQFTWIGLVVGKTLAAVAFLFPLAFLFGISFATVASCMRAENVSAARAVGMASMANTAGAAIGATIAGFCLLPWLGLAKSVMLLALLALALAAFIALAARAAMWLRVLAACVVLAAGLWVCAWPPRWEPLMLSAGAHFAPWNYVEGKRITLREHLRNERLLFYREGVSVTVSVTQTVDEKLFFCSDGKVEADTSPRSMVLQRMIGHLPMLCHPAPKRVLNIGLGAGVTLGALACHAPEALEVAEIEPAVTNVAMLWSAWNGAVLSHPNLRLHVNDGRNHLLVTTSRYDVITSDPFEPVMAGAGNLYTVEHFALARRRLAPGGIMGQFLPLYELSAEDLRIIMRSFMHVFPHAAIFFTGYDTILLGFTEGAGIDMAVIARNASRPVVRESLAATGFEHPEQILEMLVRETMDGARFIEPGMRNTDDRPVIEFSAPRSALDYQPDANQRVLLALFQQAPEYSWMGLTEELITQVQRGREAMRHVLQANIIRASGDLQGNIDLIMKAHQEAPGNPVIRNELAASLASVAGLFLQRGELQKAAVQFEVALRVQPGDFWPLYHLTHLAMSAGQREAAEAMLQQGLIAYPDAPLWIALRGKIAGEGGDAAAACRDLRVALEALPRNPELWEQYAHYLDKAGEVAAARDAHAHAAQLQQR